MKTAFAMLVMCIAAFGANVINHAMNSGKQQMRGRTDPPAYTLDVKRPCDFLKKHLPHALDEAPSDSSAWDAIDGTAVVRVRRGEMSVDMEVELIAGNELEPNRFYSVLFSGTPGTLDDTYALAIRLCDLAKLPNDRIVAWYKEKKHESGLDSAEAQIGREGVLEHSISVRSSLELEGDKPWRVLYTIYFPRAGAVSSDEEAEPDEAGIDDEGQCDGGGGS